MLLVTCSPVLPVAWVSCQCLNHFSTSICWWGGCTCHPVGLKTRPVKEHMSCLEPTTNMQTVFLVVNLAHVPEYAISWFLQPSQVCCVVCWEGFLGYCLAPCSSMRQVRTEDMATTYERTEAAQSTVVAKVRRCSYTATTPGVKDNRQCLPKKQQLSLLSSQQTMWTP